AKAMKLNLTPASSLIYIDKDNISEEMTAYVDLLYRHGIMQGDDKKYFNPSDGIKRAEFAAICNRVFESANSGTYSVEKEVDSHRGTIVSVDTYYCKLMMTQSDGTAKMIQINPKTQIVINGKVNYNGLGGISTGTTAVVAWGAFYDPEGTEPEHKVLQLHIITKPAAITGLLTGIEKIDDKTSILEIENEDGDSIYYILDQNSLTDGTPKKGKQVTFIADGVKILEMK
ncbi:MAG: S-layer homology domain-containing protein, partial [Eubacteriales bacterium]|nr:S-layer homology domain-containing protein [Eubacteriales bacterium]